MRIAHLADIQIRFGSRHEEYTEVFETTRQSLIAQKPDRIAVLGDIHHHKVNMSPKLIDMSSGFFKMLSEIAPTDVIAGNHDLNLKNVEQGDGIASIIKLMDNGVVVKNGEDVDFWQNKVYYYPDSGFYDIGKTIVYGVFSCIDGKILKLDFSDKQKDKKYIALYHGTIFGSVMDNLYKMRDEDLLKIEEFENFDMVLLGDIHEFQDFERSESMEIEDSELETYEQQGWEKE